MTVNVQDFVVVASIVFFVSTVMSIKRVLLYVIATRRQRRSVRPT
jgi:hypothetical protein